MAYRDRRLRCYPANFSAKLEHDDVAVALQREPRHILKLLAAFAAGDGDSCRVCLIDKCV